MKVLIPPDRFPLSQLTDGKKNCTITGNVVGREAQLQKSGTPKTKDRKMKVGELRVIKNHRLS